MHGIRLLLICSGGFVAGTSAAAEPPIAALAFTPDGRAVVAASQAGLHLYSWPGLERQRTIAATAANLHCLAFSPSGNRLAVGGGNPAENGSVEIFSWPSGDSVSTFYEHEDSVMAIAWWGDGKVLSASLDRQIKLHDLQQEAAVRSYQGHSRNVSSLRLLKDGKTLVSASADQSVRVWELQTGNLIRSLNQHTRPIHCLALRPSAGGLPMIASGAADRSVRFWQPTIGRMVRYVRLPAEPLDLAWLDDGRRIAAACDDGHVRLIDADQVTVKNDLPAIEGWAYTLAIHPSDGGLVVAGTGGQILRLAPELWQDQAR